MRGMVLGCFLWSGVSFVLQDMAGVVTPAPAATARETVERLTPQVPPVWEETDQRIIQLREEMKRQSQREHRLFIVLMLIPIASIAAFVCFAVWEGRRSRRFFACIKIPDAKPQMSREQLCALLKELRKLAPEEPEVAEALRRFNLL